MKNQYWTLCDKSEDCVSKCPYAEHHWYQQQGYIVGGKYICLLPDMEDCPYYQKKKYEKTSSPAQLKSDLFYFDEEYEEMFSNRRAQELINEEV